ncbi:ribosomal protein L7/L12 [Streptomyces sp. NBC_00728]|uniref:ribosomal protein L7/L12 n=1 Tax=Streptomyces sp. NBC_00728 TaxID=2903676 RepID=UPI0038709BB1
MEWTGLIALGLVIVTFAALSGKLARIDRRVARVEEQLARSDRRTARVEHRLTLILDHLGIPDDSSSHLPEVVALLQEGKKIQAIRAYREVTGAGLKEAKEAVEGMV